MFYVYVIRNLLDTSIIYVGKTKNPKSRWYDHCKLSRRSIPRYYIHRAMKQHGIENFQFELIDCVSKEENAYHAEHCWYNHFKIAGYEFYNMTECGHGPIGLKVSKDTRERISKTLKGRALPDATLAILRSRMHRAKMSKIGGAKLTDEQVHFIRKNQPRGKKAYSKLAAEFDVSESTIYNVVKRFTYKHVE